MYSAIAAIAAMAPFKLCEQLHLVFLSSYLMMQHGRCSQCHSAIHPLIRPFIHSSSDTLGTKQISTAVATKDVCSSLSALPSLASGPCQQSCTCRVLEAEDAVTPLRLARIDAARGIGERIEYEVPADPAGESQMRCN